MSRLEEGIRFLLMHCQGVFLLLVTFQRSFLVLMSLTHTLEKIQFPQSMLWHLNIGPRLLNTHDWFVRKHIPKKAFKLTKSRRHQLRIECLKKQIEWQAEVTALNIFRIYLRNGKILIEEKCAGWVTSQNHVFVHVKMGGSGLTRNIYG